MPTLTLRTTTIKHSWQRRPIRIHEVDLTLDDGRTILAGRFRSKKRAEELIKDNFQTYGFEERTDKWRGHPDLVQVGWYAKNDPLRMVIGIDESI